MESKSTSRASKSKISLWINLTLFAGLMVMSGIGYYQSLLSGALLSHHFETATFSSIHFLTTLTVFGASLAACFLLIQKKNRSEA